jgi:hypothetical protein
MESEFLGPGDTQVRVWVLIGLIVRLAMRSGYHRDPNHYPTISVFKGELRRRVWNMIKQADIIISFQVGLPSMMSAIQSDTGLPHNLADSDLSEDMTELPPSRPLSDTTPVSYLIYKYKICCDFGIIVEQAHSINFVEYDKIKDLDVRLQDSHAAVPDILRMRPIQESATDSADLVMKRFNAEILYLKARCVLHRKYVTEGRSEPRYLHSRKVCVDSAMELLNHHCTIHHAMQPGGKLYSEQWYMWSLTTDDFLMAAMIICLCLKLDYAGAELTADQRSPFPVRGKINDERRKEMVQALESSYRIWVHSPAKSTAIRKATEVMAIILDEVKGRHDPSTNESEQLERTQNTHSR